MGRTIRTHLTEKGDLAHFWRQFFQETPVCSLPGCGVVASEVDTYFPYIDDFNRCDVHPLPSQEYVPRSPGARCRFGGEGKSGSRRRWRTPGGWKG